MALVRARRLVFEGEFYKECVTPCGKYLVHKRLDNLWDARRDGNYLVSPTFQTEQEVVDICQKDFDSRWLGSTEVMPLEWEDSLSCSTANTAISEYEVYDDGYWIGEYHHLPCDSRDHGKQLCEEHNRKTILGE